MAQIVNFGPLQRVPAFLLNALQKSLLDQRGSGTGNTLALGLNNVLVSWDRGPIQVALAQPATGLTPIEIDLGKDWRDRQITINYFFDPLRDIRPGEAGDFQYARDRGTRVFYSRLGGRWALSPSLGIFINASGIMYAEKEAGYGYLEIIGSTQLKERS